MKKCVVISTAAADNTGAGGPVGVYGNVACVARSGYEVTNLVIAKPTKVNQNEFPVHFINPENKTVAEIQKDLDQFLGKMKPEIVWLHHYWVWDYFKSFADRLPFVLLSGDPDWELLLLHRETKKNPTDPLRKILEWYRFQKQLKSARKREKQIFREAAAHRGVLACWCPSSVEDLKQQTGKQVESCPLAFPDWNQRKEINKKFLLMLGNVNGAHTRSGLKYFMDFVWTEWCKVASNGKMPQIRMVGGGKLPEAVKLPENSHLFERIGFVEELEDEWVQALATVVPVPVELGFRTRIVESWSKGVPVIAHPSASSSLPEAVHRQNILFFENAQELKEAVNYLSDGDNYRKIVAAGLKVFSEHYLVDNVFPRYARLSEMAINNRINDHS